MRKYDVVRKELVECKEKGEYYVALDTKEVVVTILLWEQMRDLGLDALKERYQFSVPQIKQLRAKMQQVTWNPVLELGSCEPVEDTITWKKSAKEEIQQDFSELNLPEKTVRQLRERELKRKSYEVFLPEDIDGISEDVLNTVKERALKRNKRMGVSLDGEVSSDKKSRIDALRDKYKGIDLAAFDDEVEEDEEEDVIDESTNTNKETLEDYDEDSSDEDADD